MSKYLLILFWALAVVYFLPRLNLQRPEEVCGQTEFRYPWLVAFLVFVPVIWMAGHRGWVADTPLYMNGFRNMPTSFNELPGYVNGIKKDPGFYTMGAIIHILIGDNVELYLTLIALVQAIGVVFLFRRYSSSYSVSFFLFIASADYFSWMFNGIRQFVAVTIILFATPFMLKKRYIPAILMIVFASLMHRSALLMIPIILISTGEAWNKRTLLFIALVLLAVLYVGTFTNLLDDALQNTQYANVVDDYTQWEDNGTNPIRVLIYSLPALISFLGRKYIRESGDSVINLCANMSIASAGLYVISMVTSGIFIGRLPIYASLYGYILLPWEIDRLFDQNTTRFTYGLMILGYLGYYYYQMHIVWGWF